MLGTEIITRRTNNPRCLSLEMVRSLFCNFYALSFRVKLVSASKARRRLRVFGIGR